MSEKMSATSSRIATFMQTLADERDRDRAELLEHVEKALGYAATQVTSRTDRNLVVTEFWHSMNRKQDVPNDDVEVRIEKTLRVSREIFRLMGRS